jgi:hypothetical protein
MGMESGTKPSEMGNQHPHRGAWGLAARRRDAGSGRHDAPTPRPAVIGRCMRTRHPTNLSVIGQSHGLSRSIPPTRRMDCMAGRSARPNLAACPVPPVVLRVDSGAMPRDVWARGKLAGPAREPGPVSSRGARGSPSSTAAQLSKDGRCCDVIIVTCFIA